ncbi:MAG: hypothetical protein ACI3X8_06230 [Alloprevotella sp.]
MSRTKPKATWPSLLTPTPTALAQLSPSDKSSRWKSGANRKAHFVCNEKRLLQPIIFSNKGCRHFNRINQPIYIP